MINYQLGTFVVTQAMLAQDLWHAHAQKEDGYSVLTTADRERVAANLKALQRDCRSLMFQTAEFRFDRIWSCFSSPGALTHATLFDHLRALKDAIDDDAKTACFYHYPRDKALLLLRVPGDWAQTLAAFPSAAPEIQDAVDLYASDHPTGSIFHLMRVAEHGLRALAKERRVVLPKGKPLEWGTWQDLIREITKSAEVLAKTKPAGQGKDEALSFYRGALAHFEAFKDQYRNTTMHVRKRYETAEAEMALNHVMAFMNGLSAKIGEKTTRQIRWRF